MSKILVTGASGFIGRHIVPKLVKEGYDVRAVSRRGVENISLNLFDIEEVHQFLKRERPNCLLHLAWNVDAGYMENAENLDWVASSLNLLRTFAENGGQRAVFAGSCIEYDWKYGFLSEDLTPLTSNSLYGTCKAALYKMASTYARNVGLSFACGRVFFLYGKGEKKERLMPSLIDSFSRGQVPNLKYPYIKRDYMHVDDVAAAFIAILKSSFDGAVNIASGEALQLREIAEKIAFLMGREMPVWEQKEDETIIPLVLGDTRRLNNIVGFSPSVSWDEGLEEVIEKHRR